MTNHCLNRKLDHDSFNLMVKYLLFFATYHPVPISSVIDKKIRENLKKGGDAKNIAFWNWTPEQKNILFANITRMIMTSFWSTGKTRILLEKAKMLARMGEFVIFVLHYEEAENDFSDSAPLLLYYSLMNEIENDPDIIKDKFRLIVSQDLRKDVLNGALRGTFDGTCPKSKSLH